MILLCTVLSHVSQEAQHPWLPPANKRGSEFFKTLLEAASPVRTTGLDNLSGPLLAPASANTYGESMKSKALGWIIGPLRGWIWEDSERS